ncbi:LEM-3-like GIY-YIG domain-containing protein [Leptospira sp. GIMC2001]|uniref:LEM-3-like GIY-YIG domain-containing protein n=1 Tax=Leptospira sp. GIMC2001 TaxID=1513297 RepID=UPI00234A1C9B|nr:hypothetical protein [Leptospira sp. GIMC2001]WCL50779.1 hypothetical protein O4O04_08195 [Leptospira sp. GIMC2001]
MKKFNKKIQEALGYYVYGLIDPFTKRIFYIGKGGKNSRPHEHLKPSKIETDKTLKISEIRKRKKEPIIDIIRYGLESNEIAHQIEAAIIDTIGLENLTNKVRGHGIENGRLSIPEIERLYGSDAIFKKDITEKMMMFFISRTYSTTLNEIEIYDATRQFWFGVAESTRTNNKQGELDYKIALSIFDSVIVRVYSIESWFQAGKTLTTRENKDRKNRFEFIGNKIENHYLLGKKILNDDGKEIKAYQAGYGYIN